MDRIKDIYRRYLTDSCTEEELKFLLRYFETEDQPENLERLIEGELLEVEDRNKPAYLKGVVDRNRIALQDRIQGGTLRTVKSRKLLKGLSIAASVCLVSLFTYLYFNKQTDTGVVESVMIEDDIEPGSNRATLTLSDGKKILLNEDQEAIQIDGDVIKYEDGTEVVATTDVQMVLVSTPRAGQYQVRLPDGTKVWLNAESSIEYPTVFEGTERLVTLQGEAYFEVAHKADQPFIVQSEKQRVQVLGTSFNVQAYPEDNTTVTTLVEGSVMLESNNTENKTMLTPQYQAVLGSSGYKQRKVDVSSYTAWKDGMFRFKGTPLSEALQQLERWYDLEVDYSDIPVDVKVHASIKRDRKLSSILYALEEISNVKFKIQGRRLMFMK